MTREEAILRLEVLKDFSHKNELKNIHEAIDMAIESLESEIRPVVKGEWKRTPTGQPYCSVCGDFPWEHESSTRSYCSECGAKMKEVAE